MEDFKNERKAKSAETKPETATEQSAEQQSTKQPAEQEQQIRIFTEKRENVIYTHSLFFMIS